VIEFLNPTLLSGKLYEDHGPENHSHRRRHRHCLVVGVLPAGFLNSRLLVSKGISKRGYRSGAQRVAVSDARRRSNERRRMTRQEESRCRLEASVTSS
jgi:hypothetical protein